MKDDRIYFLHIRDAIQHILEYTAPGKDSFFADRKTQDAVVRNLELSVKRPSGYRLPSKTPILTSLGNP